ncbi:MAG TPA: protein kinase, partial [Solirubrobacteraceae bacterium]|nr:protein kinase [Solirubrobacteraceae bacterium]
GGMGVVYRATELALDRVVALKTISPALASDPSFRERFVRESKAAAGIDHPNVLPIFSAGEEGEVPYIAMRFVDGEDLRSLLRAGGPLPPERAASIVAQVAGALDAAHARGLVHRDVKPANVLLDRGDHAYLTDFGLTKRLGTSATRSAGWVGTLGYVAPEQIRDERIDGRADVYALGCVLHHLLKGTPPFERSSDEATLWAHLHAPPPEVAGPFGPIVARALAKDPADRYATAGDLGRDALAAVGRAPLDEPTRVTPDDARADVRWAAVEPTREALRSRSRRRAPLLAALAVLLLAGGAGVAALLARDDDDDPADSTPRSSTRPPAATIEGVDVGERPNGVAIARGAAYVAGPRNSRLVKVDLAGFDRAVPSHRVGTGATDLDAGFGALWVTTSTSQGATVIRIDLDSGEQATAPLPPGKPVAVSAGAEAVWVGIRGDGAGTVARIDPETAQVADTIPIPTGVQDLEYGGEAVWLTNRDADTLTRIDPGTGETKEIPAGRDPAGLAHGAGAVWTASTGDDSVERIDRRRPADRATIGVPGQPRAVGYGGGRLWVASFTTSELVKIDGETGRRLGGAIRTALNPTKLVVASDAVYVIAAAGGRLERVKFEARR